MSRDLPEQILHTILTIPSFIIDTKMHCPYPSIYNAWPGLERLWRGWPTVECGQQGENGDDDKKSFAFAAV